MFMDWQIKDCKDSSLLGLIDRVNTIPIQTSESFVYLFVCLFSGTGEAEIMDSEL